MGVKLCEFGALQKIKNGFDLGKNSSRTGNEI
jgi:hypothetical protein